MVRSASRTSTPAEGTISQEIKFTPPPPAPSSDPEEPLSFWEAVAQVPLDQWGSDGEKGYKVYLFEGFGLKGPYLSKIMEPIDIEWVKQSFGGGDYSATLNNPVGKIESSARFSIDGDKRRKPPQNAQAAGVPQHQPADSFQSQVLEILRESTRRQEQMMERIMDARNANTAPAVAIPAIDPNIMLRGVVEMFSGLLTKAQAPQPQMGILEMVALIEKFRGPDLLDVLTKAKEAGLIPAAGSGGPTDLVTQFKQLKEAAEVVGLGEGKGKSLGEAVIEKLPDILEAGGKAMDKYQQIESTRLETARHVRAIQQQHGATVITPPPAASAGQMPQHTGAQHTVRTPMQTSGTGLQVEPPGTPPTPEAIAAAEQQLAFIKGKIVEMVANGDSGGEIIDFLDKIDKTICDQFAGASAEQIGLFFSADPVLKKAASLPRFKPVIAEMVEELNGPDEPMEPVRPN